MFRGNAFQAIFVLLGGVIVSGLVALIIYGLTELVKFLMGG